jgi:dUTP pyrophosphatase
MSLVEGLDMPRYAYPGDAGLDLVSAQDVILQPYQRAVVPCGIALAIPEGFAGFVLPRSGLAARHGISIVNAPGLIDSSYRGEVKAILINLDPHEAFMIKQGDRIAQLSILKTPVVELAEVQQLDETDRGSGGFGSSGI